MTKLLTAIKIGSFLIAFVAVFLPMYSDMILNAEITVTVKPELENDITNAKITIKNTGHEPATNLRITVNPEYNIINHTTIFHTEEVDFRLNGLKSIIGEMDRLANNQKVVLETFIDSTDLSDFAVYVTHDTGSTSYFYDKEKQKQQWNVLLILSLIVALMVSIAAGLSTVAILQRYEIKIQTTGNRGVNFQGDVSNSNVAIFTGDAQPMKPTKDSLEKVEATKPDDNSIRKLLTRIGKDKISNLLQEAKLIAIDTNDKDMKAWVDLELNGFAPPPGKQVSRKEAIEKGLLPEYRDISGKFFVKTGEDVHELSYPILFGNDIKKVENTIEIIKQGGRAFIKHTFPKDTKLVGGQTGDLDLPRMELENIVHGAERKLSQFLESKLTKN